MLFRRVATSPPVNLPRGRETFEVANETSTVILTGPGETLLPNTEDAEYEGTPAHGWSQAVVAARVALRPGQARRHTGPRRSLAG